MNVKKGNSFGIIFIIFLTSFLLGMLFGLKIVNYTEKNLLETYYNISLGNKKEDLDLSKFWLVYNIILNNYFNANNLNREDLEEAAVAGLVRGIGDRFSEYFNVEENKSFSDSLHGDFEGVGAVVQVNPLGVLVSSVIKGSPAKENDVRAGDIIISANATPLAGMTVNEAVSFIKGPAGSSVVLEILREGEAMILKKEIIRKKVVLPSVEFEELSNNLGYIAINMFGDNTSKEFREALNSLKNTKGLIIDLRDNGGGYLMSAVDILSDLVEKGKVLVETRYNDGRQDEFYSSVNNGNIYKGKIVVLINENSASASEIVAGALRDLDLAIIVGKKSYGKGSVQKPFDLSDGSMVKLTVAKWFTPNGVNIDEEGIVPDIEVSFIEDDYKNLYDRQKEEAKRILLEFVESGNLREVIENNVKIEEE